MDATDAFSKAKKLREEKQRLAKNATSEGSFSFEEIQYLGLDGENKKVFRILGDPVDTRTKPTDHKLILTSLKVLDDTAKKYIRIVWPYTTNNKQKTVPDPDWILTRLYNKVNEGKWVNYTEDDIGKNGVKRVGDKIVNDRGTSGTFIKYNTEMGCYKRIEHGVKANEKFPDGIKFWPKNRVVMNVIDRMDDWCKSNKHSKILASKVGKMEKDGKTILFPTPGIPASAGPNERFKGAYDMVFDGLGESCSTMADMDIAMWLLGMSYQFKNITESLPENIKKLGNADPLTAEEQAYVMYDLDKLFDVTSYNKLLKNLSGLFKQTDAELGSRFYDELVELATTERLANADKKAVEAEDADDDDAPESSTEQKKEEEKPAQRKRQEQTESNPSLEKFKSIFKNWGKLSDKEQSLMIKYIERFDGDVPVWTKEADAFECTTKGCTFEGSSKVPSFPSSVFTCPACGVKN